MMQMCEKEQDELIERQWKELNKMGIYTVEQFNEAIDKLNEELAEVRFLWMSIPEKDISVT